MSLSYLEYTMEHWNKIWIARFVIENCTTWQGAFISCGSFGFTLRWRYNGHDGVSNHQPHGCLLNRLFKRKSKKTSKLRVTGLCVGNSPRSVNSPHKGPVTRKIFPFDDVIMNERLLFLLLCFFIYLRSMSLSAHGVIWSWDPLAGIVMCCRLSLSAHYSDVIMITMAYQITGARSEIIHPTQASLARSPALIILAGMWRQSLLLPRGIISIYCGIVTP